jgi:hypothetical protein
MIAPVTLPQLIEAVAAGVSSAAELPVWVTPVITVLVGFISAAALLLVKKTRNPVGITDLWAENRLMREELAEVATDVRALSDGFTATDNRVERIVQAWPGPKPIPPYTALELEDVKRARAVRHNERPVAG